jgi:hypothetical protein
MYEVSNEDVEEVDFVLDLEVNLLPDVAMESSEVIVY